MASVGPELEWAARLSGQLQTLSELAESLTFRVLELEERMGEQELQVASLQMASEDLNEDLTRAMEERLMETEDRLVRMEGLLQGGGKRKSPGRSLRAVSKPSPAKLDDTYGMETSLPPEEEDFLDEAHGEALEMEGEDEGFVEDPPFLEDLHEDALAS